MKFIGDICYGKSEYSEQYLDIYLPDANSFKVFVYIHGGGIIVKKVAMPMNLEE